MQLKQCHCLYEMIVVNLTSSGTLIMAAPPILPCVPATNHSYFIYLNNSLNNTYYDDIMEVFSISLNNQHVLTPTEVQNLVLSVHGVMPLLLLHNSLMDCYLQPSLFCQCIGIPDTSWNKSMFTTKRSQYNNHAITVNWLMEYFHPVKQQVLSPTMATIQTSFAASPTQR